MINNKTYNTYDYNITLLTLKRAFSLKIPQTKKFIMCNY